MSKYQEVADRIKSLSNEELDLVLDFIGVLKVHEHEDEKLHLCSICKGMIDNDGFGHDPDCAALG